MPHYLIYFNQQWVGDHTDEWFMSRGPLAHAVVEEMKTAGVYVFAGGLEEHETPIHLAYPVTTDGPFTETKEYIGGFALVEVADDVAAQGWADRVAEACGWPQAVRRFK